MSASAGIIGKGTTIGYSAVPATTYTLLAEVTGEIPFPNIQSENDVDFTNMTSPNNFVETKPSGWLKAEPIDLELTYVKTQHGTLVGMINVNKTWEITTPDSGTCIFTGYISAVGGTIPNRERVTSKIKMVVTGMPAFA